MDSVTQILEVTNPAWVSAIADIAIVLVSLVGVWLLYLTLRASISAIRSANEANRVADRANDVAKQSIEISRETIRIQNRAFIDFHKADALIEACSDQYAKKSGITHRFILNIYLINKGVSLVKNFKFRKYNLEIIDFDNRVNFDHRNLEKGEVEWGYRGAIMSEELNHLNFAFDISDFEKFQSAVEKIKVSMWVSLTFQMDVIYNDVFDSEWCETFTVWSDFDGNSLKAKKVQALSEDVINISIEDAFGKKINN